MKIYIFARILLEQIVCKYSKEQQNQQNQPNKTQNKQNQEQRSKIQFFEGNHLPHWNGNLEKRDSYLCLCGKEKLSGSGKLLFKRVCGC